ncbi:MAG: sugar transferase [bacterium]
MLRKTYVALDLLVTALSLVLALLVRFSFDAAPPNFELVKKYLATLYFALPLWYFLLRFNGLYESRRTDNALKVSWIAAKSVAEGIVLLILLAYVMKVAPISRSFLFLFGGINVSLLVLEKALLKKLLHAIREKGYNFRRVLIVGSGVRALSVARKILSHREWGLQIFGFLSHSPADVGKSIEDGGQVLGTLSDLQQVISSSPIDEVHIALPLLNLDTITRMLEICEEQGVRARVMLDLYSPTISKVHLEDFHGTPMLTFTASPVENWQMFLKAALDRSTALVMLSVLWPLFLIVALLIKIDSAGPVFFVQERVGLYKRRFRMYKFRTMVDRAEELLPELSGLNELSGPVFKMKRDPRRTRVGRILRMASLDELPQLLNVLRGEMSFIGPRPPIPSEIAQYKPWQYRRLSMKPGISGLWQVSGRTELDFDRWMELDLFYIDHWSLKLDFMILLKTLPAVLLGRGAS